MQASDAFTTSTYYNRRAPHWGSRHVVARNPSPALQVSDLHAMEGLVLQTLDFRLNSPTAHTFLSIFSEGVGLHGRAAALASMYTVSRHLQCSTKAALPAWMYAVRAVNHWGRPSTPAAMGTVCCAASQEHRVEQNTKTRG